MEDHVKPESPGDSPINPNPKPHEEASFSPLASDKEDAGGEAVPVSPLVADGGGKGRVTYKDEDAYLNSFPPGYRFKPLDSELINFYLKKKVLKKPLPPNKIREVKLYQFNPDDLAARYEPMGDREWYFFTPRDRKYKNGYRPSRAAGDGYWKATGADKPVYDVDGKEKIGSKKSLVFYRGKPGKGNKTDWIMHEFSFDSAPKNKPGGNDMMLDKCVLCRIHKKPAESSKARQEKKRSEDGTENVVGQEQQQQEPDAAPPPPPPPLETNDHQILAKFPTLLPKESQHQQTPFLYVHEKLFPNSTFDFLPSPLFYQMDMELPALPESYGLDPVPPQASNIDLISSHLVIGLIPQRTSQEDDNSIWNNVMEQLRPKDDDRNGGDDESDQGGSDGK